MGEYTFIDIKSYIKNIEDYYGHTCEGREKELLTEHMKRTRYYLELMLEAHEIGKRLDELMDRMTYKGNILSNAVKEFIITLCINGIYLHDLGKINPNFQHYQMANRKFEQAIIDKRHSLLSSYLYSYIFIVKLEAIENFINDDEDDLLYYFIYAFSYTISQHHGQIQGLNDYRDKIKRFNNRFKIAYTKGFQGKHDEIAMSPDYEGLKVNDLLPNGSSYLLIRLFYSMLINSDYYATYDYMAGKPIYKKDLGLVDDAITDMVNQYRNSPIYEQIRLYEHYKHTGQGENPFDQTPINILRSEMFLEAESTLLANRDKNIFYFEAPTGSGKTNTSIHLALTLMAEHMPLNKLLYIFPFNTLVDQTYQTLTDAFKGTIDPIVINAITPITVGTQNEEEELLDYNKAYLNYISMNYPLIVTTHVRFFNMLFGTKREDNMPLAHLVNSVIIIDEIQSYNIDIWKEIIFFFDLFSAILNIKLIIMSATLPKLDELLNTTSSKYCNLILDRNRYFMDPLFKKRVELDFSLVNTPPEGEEIEEKLYILLNKVESVWEERGEAKILVEFLKTKTARSFYNMAKERWVEKYKAGIIMELTGSDNKNERNRIINGVKNTLINCLLISTQVIEAGVDIDMDVGFKSISFLDAEEQFLGRINRSCKRDNCIAYFFNIDEARTVYRKDLRLDLSVTDIEIQEMLVHKDFTDYYKRVLEDVDRAKKGCNDNDFIHIEKAISDLDFLEIENRLTLIEDQNTIQLFLNIEEEIEEIIEGKLVKHKVQGSQVWDDFIALIHDYTIPFAEKKIQLSHIKAKMNYFLYMVYVQWRPGGVKRTPNHYTDVLGDMYYYENGQHFLDDNKFDKKKAGEILFGRQFNTSDFM